MSVRLSIIGNDQEVVVESTTNRLDTTVRHALHSLVMKRKAAGDVQLATSFVIGYTRTPLSEFYSVLVVRYLAAP